MNRLGDPANLGASVSVGGRDMQRLLNLLGTHFNNMSVKESQFERHIQSSKTEFLIDFEPTFKRLAGETGISASTIAIRGRLSSPDQ
ncbi:hypothetical protein [Bradyrhizobium sp. CCGUVB23]|uniref:hypothetical protein n=1 Tax=Bradyrhizobium sp. CCGUVB23 TaxID=2949630 RepID=UPI0020B33029|nr:hypothetical protein [Bradyrhizobium sp. CCGUVB23]MCP3468637.1 hypothetical protein [Bradyrhizobium sp. CCGUVB23]